MSNYPPNVKLNDYSEFDAKKYKNTIIEFAPGGTVGDREWNLQFWHNLSVSSRRAHPWPNIMMFINLEKFIVKYGIENIENISIYVNDILLNCYRFNDLILFKIILKQDLEDENTEIANFIKYNNIYPVGKFEYFVLIKTHPEFNLKIVLEIKQDEKIIQEPLTIDDFITIKNTDYLEEVKEESQHENTEINDFINIDSFEEWRQEPSDDQLEQQYGYRYE